MNSDIHQNNLELSLYYYLLLIILNDWVNARKTANNQDLYPTIFVKARHYCRIACGLWFC